MRRLGSRPSPALGGDTMKKVFLFGALTALILAGMWQILPIPADAG